MQGFNISQVNIVLPLIFLLVCAFLIVLPLYTSPMETGIGVAITLTGIPVYLLLIWPTNKPWWLQNAIGTLSIGFKLLNECRQMGREMWVFKHSQNVMI